MDAADTDKKSPAPMLIWLAFLVAAVVITGLEWAAVGAGLALTVFKVTSMFGKINSHNGPTLLVILSVATLLESTIFAFLNPLLFTKLAGNRRRAFAQGFAVASLWSFVFGGMLLAHQLAELRPNESWLAAGMVPALSVILGGVLQLWLSLKVAKENLRLYKEIEQLGADDKTHFEDIINNLKKAHNKNECMILATNALQMLSIKGNHLSVDDVHTLTKELFRQNRHHDARDISDHYLKLVESTLLQ